MSTTVRLPLLVGLVFVLMQLGLIIRDAFDFPFSDEIVLFRHYFDSVDFKQLFLQQHGPHRQGVGAWIMYFLLHGVGWDFRALSYLALAVIMAATAIFARAATRQGAGPAVVALAVAMMMSLRGSELVTVTPNISHSLLPLLFAVTIYVQLLRSSVSLRSELFMLSVAVVALFTGFGTFVYSAYLAVQGLRWLDVLSSRGACNSTCGNHYAKYVLPVGCMLICIAALTLFFTDYDVRGNGGCTNNLAEDYPSIIRYALRLLGLPFVPIFSDLRTVLGAVGLILMVGITILSIGAYLREGEVAGLAGVFLILVTLYSVVVAAIGRHCVLGEAPRYYALTSLGYVAIAVYVDSRYRHLFSPRLRSVVIGLLAVNILASCYVGEFGSRHFRAKKQILSDCAEQDTLTEDCVGELRFFPYLEDLDQFLRLLEEQKGV